VLADAEAVGPNRRLTLEEHALAQGEPLDCSAWIEALCQALRPSTRARRASSSL
jgi:hypothetical protein